MSAKKEEQEESKYEEMDNDNDNDYVNEEDEEKSDENEQITETEREEVKDDKNYKLYDNNNNNKKFEERIEPDYYGQKGIIKRTIGIGDFNVRVYDNYSSKKNQIRKKEIIQKQKWENSIPKNIEQNIPKNDIISKRDQDSNDVLIYKIDGKKFEIHVKWFYIMSKEKEQNINITISTIYPGSQIMHWGIYKSSSPKDWSMPPKSCYPKLTKNVNNRALETKFSNSNNNNERIISIILPKKISYNDYIEGIYFVIYDPVKNIWYNNFKRNFNIQFNNNKRY